ncbi:MAG: hypothetical protein JWN44_5426 [Myxococcales bacterium]|nr:hypothetical protein [Myxococcales bacterium]
MGLELGILVADPAMLGRALDLARNSDEAQLFLMDDGVRAADAPALRAAIDDGLEATLCAMDAEARGVVAVRGGPRFGSQWDHAVMVRDAARVVAMTGGRIDDNGGGEALGSPRSALGRGARRVAVRLTREASHPKIAQALRSAVGYAGVELAVILVVEPPARALLNGEDHPPAVMRALSTLRALGHKFTEVDSTATRVSCDVEVSW